MDQMEKYLKRLVLLELSTRLSNYDANSGGGYGKGVAGHRSRTRPIGGDYGIYPDPFYDDDLDDDTEEFFEDDIDISSKIDQNRSKVDIGRRDPAGTSFDNVGYAQNIVSEIIDPRDDATTPAMKGMLSPGQFTYSKSNIKGPAFGSQSSATYIRNKPGRISGTQWGTSRAPAPSSEEENDNTEFSLQDMLKNPEEYALLKHRKETQKIKNTLKEIFLKK